MPMTAEQHALTPDGRARRIIYQDMVWGEILEETGYALSLAKQGLRQYIAAEIRDAIKADREKRKFAREQIARILLAEQGDPGKGQPVFPWEEQPEAFRERLLRQADALVAQITETARATPTRGE